MRMPGLSPDTRNMQPIQTIAIAGGKGGIGKSVIAVNLATALGAARQDVLLVDGDLEMGNIDSLLSLRPEYTLTDVFSGYMTLHEILVAGPSGVTVLPSSSGVQKMANLSQIEHASLIGLFSDLHTSADTMIVDVATGMSRSALCFCRAVREVVVVVVDEPAALHDAFTTIKVLNEHCKVRRFRIIANKTKSLRHGREVYSALMHLTDQNMDVLLDYCGSVPSDPQLKLAVCEQRSVVEAYPRSPSALAFRKLGARIAQWPQPRTPGGHIEFFVERLIQTADGTR